MRRAAWLTLLGMVVSSCSTSPVAVTSPSLTSTTMTSATTVAAPIVESEPPAETTPASIIETPDLEGPLETTVPPGQSPGDLNRIVFEFDPRIGSAEDLRQALEGYTAGPYELLRLIEEGDAAIREVVFEYLAQPSAWNVQALVGAQAYGSPAGAPDAPIPWPTDVKLAIHASLQAAADATFGEHAEMMIDLQRAFLEFELSICEREGGCDFGDLWYRTGGAVASPEGTVANDRFEGTITLASDTGEGARLDVVVLRTGDSWLPTSGFPAFGPALAISQPPMFVMINQDIEVTGFADPTAKVVLDGEWIELDSETGSWQGVVSLTPGPNTVSVSATGLDGSVTSLDQEYVHRPDAERHLALLGGVEDGRLIVHIVAEDGTTDDPDLGDHQDELGGLPLDPGAAVFLIDYTVTKELDLDPIPVDEFVRILSENDDQAYIGGVVGAPVWLTIADGTILQVEALYIP